MPFIPENELERALVKAVQDRETAPDFYRLLLDSNLLVLGSVEGQEDATEQFTLAPGGRLNLVTGQKDGSQFLPVFSSLKRMQDYVKQDSKYLSVNGRALLDVTRGAPVTLNPASEYGKELAPREVQQLLDGPGGGEARIIVGEAVYPAPLVEALTALFASRPDIETAWMIQVSFAGAKRLAVADAGYPSRSRKIGSRAGVRRAAHRSPQSRRSHHRPVAGAAFLSAAHRLHSQLIQRNDPCPKF